MDLTLCVFVCSVNCVSSLQTPLVSQCQPNVSLHIVNFNFYILNITKMVLWVGAGAHKMHSGYRDLALSRFKKIITAQKQDKTSQHLTSLSVVTEKLVG